MPVAFVPPLSVYRKNTVAALSSALMLERSTDVVAKVVLVVAVFTPGIAVKLDPSKLQDQIPELNPVEVPRVAKDKMGFSFPVRLVEKVINELLPGNGADVPPTINESEAPAGSLFSALRVEPPKSSTSPPQVARLSEPEPEVAAIEVGTPPLPGAAAVGIFSVLKFQYAMRPA